MLVKILDRQDERALDALEVLLVYGFGATHLPDIYDVFGREYLVKFLDVFAGVKFEVPSYKELRKCARNVQIYMTVEEHGLKAVADLATEFDLTEKEVRNIHKEVRRIQANFFKVGVRRGGNGGKRRAGKRSRSDS